MKRLTFTSLAALLTLSTLLGCDQDDGPATVSVECRVNSDCPASLACVDSACVEPDQCLGDDCPCEADQDCQGDTLCDADTGQCYTPRCFADTDCALGQSCVRGVCGDNPQADRDGDSVADLEDNCPELPNTDQADNDADTTGDLCDSDDDNDALPDLADNCPLTANPVQGDADDDGLGNACDEDAPGITVEGSVDFSARPDADLANAQLLLSGVEAPATLSPVTPGVDRDINPPSI